VPVVGPSAGHGAGRAVLTTRFRRYKEEAQLYRDEHLRDRQHPHCYVQYMVAVVNNCQTFK